MKRDWMIIIQVFKDTEFFESVELYSEDVLQMAKYWYDTGERPCMSIAWISWDTELFEVVE